MKKIFTLTIISLILLTGCGRKRNGNMNFQEQLTKVSTEQIKQQSIIDYVNVQGKLEGIYDISLKSEVSGKITNIYKKLGDKVQKGEKIASIDNIDLQLQLEQAEANYLSVEANFDSENIKMQSNEKLYKKEAISETEYQLAKASFKQASANLKGAEANLKSAQRKFNNSQFVAPISGIITTLPISIGETIGNNSEICTIVDSKKMLLKTGVGESDLEKLEVGNIVELQTKTGSLKFEGKVIALGKKPSTGDVNYPIHIEIENSDDKLFSGQLVKGKISATTIDGVIAINASRISSNSNGNYVYLVSNDDTIEKRNVKISQTIRNYKIIESGISENESLIISETTSLKEGQKVISRNNVALENSNNKTELEG